MNPESIRATNDASVDGCAILERCRDDMCREMQTIILHNHKFLDTQNCFWYVDCTLEAAILCIKASDCDWCISAGAECDTSDCCVRFCTLIRSKMSPSFHDKISCVQMMVPQIKITSLPVIWYRWRQPYYEHRIHSIYDGTVASIDAVELGGVSIGTVSFHKRTLAVA